MVVCLSRSIAAGFYITSAINHLDGTTMTRINTNVPSLVAQSRLQNSNQDLQTALTRLSTGLRINTGADDPAGLIASEALRSEITSLGKAVSNTRRASQIISTADSGLGQVSNLLNDIRGLVVEAANSGGLSTEEIAANQLQIDSSLEAINRISQSTTFQGSKLLDGTLDFVSTARSVSNRLLGRSPPCCRSPRTTVVWPPLPSLMIHWRNSTGLPVNFSWILPYWEIGRA